MYGRRSVCRRDMQFVRGMWKTERIGMCVDKHEYVSVCYCLCVSVCVLSVCVCV